MGEDEVVHINLPLEKDILKQAVAMAKRDGVKANEWMGILVGDLAEGLEYGEATDEKIGIWKHGYWRGRQREAEAQARRNGEG